MSYPTEILQAFVWEDGSCYLMARLLGHAGTVATRASISSVAVHAFDQDSSNDQTLSTAPTVASVVYDTLQTTALDPRWTKDSTGYNFGYTVPASAFPTGGHSYRVEVTLTPLSGEPFYVGYDLQAIERIGG